MDSFNKQRLENGICFFAHEFQRRARKPLPSMGLWKLLAFLDFWGVREFGRPVFGLRYLAWKWGPVPIDVYQSPPASSLFIFQPKGENRFDIIAKGKPDMGFFSRVEADRMNELVEIFADPSMSTKLMSEASHDEIQAWRRTWRTSPNKPIDFKLEFPGDIDTKPEEELTPEEENFLVWRGWQKIHAAG